MTDQSWANVNQVFCQMFTIYQDQMTNIEWLIIANDGYYQMISLKCTVFVKPMHSKFTKRTASLFIQTIER